MEDSSIKKGVVVAKKGGFLYFKANLLLCNLGLLMEEVNSKIANLPRHLIFCLGICLDPPPRPSCFVQDVITKIQDVITKIQDVIVSQYRIEYFSIMFQILL
jgi:hypothetical protein